MGVHLNYPKLTTQEKYNMTKTEIEERKAKRKAYFQKMKETYEKIDLHQMHDFAKKVADQQAQKELSKYPDGEPEFSV